MTKVVGGAGMSKRAAMVVTFAGAGGSGVRTQTKMDRKMVDENQIRASFLFDIM